MISEIDNSNQSWNKNIGNGLQTLFGRIVRMATERYPKRHPILENPPLGEPSVLGWLTSDLVSGAEGSQRIIYNKALTLEEYNLCVYFLGLETRIDALSKAIDMFDAETTKSRWPTLRVLSGLIQTHDNAGYWLIRNELTRLSCKLDALFNQRFQRFNPSSSPNLYQNLVEIENGIKDIENKWNSFLEAEAEKATKEYDV